MIKHIYTFYFTEGTYSDKITHTQEVIVNSDYSLPKETSKYYAYELLAEMDLPENAICIVAKDYREEVEREQF